MNGYCDGYVDSVDARFGWILATNVGACDMGGCDDVRLYRTTNGGAGWTVAQRWLWLRGGGRGFLHQPHFVSDRVGFIPVTDGTLAAPAIFLAESRSLTMAVSTGSTRAPAATR